jgi:hypothetical protein
VTVKAYVDPDSPLAIASRGLRLVFPGREREPFRASIRKRFTKKACGTELFVQVYEHLHDQIGPPEHLPPRVRLALIRLAVRLVSRGPADSCRCDRCEKSRERVRVYEEDA